MPKAWQGSKSNYDAPQAKRRRMSGVPKAGPVTITSADGTTTKVAAMKVADVKKIIYKQGFH